jgi:DNA polymerase-3 subunit delta
VRFSAKKATANRLVLLTGSEEVLRLEALKMILKELEMPEDDPDLRSVAADGFPVAQWSAEVSVIPFLAPRRVLVVRHIGRIRPPQKNPSDLREGELTQDQFLEEMAALPESSLLILVGDDEGGSSNRRTDSDNRVAAWERLIKKTGAEIVSFSPDANAVKKEIATLAEKNGKKIRPAVAQTLAEMVGGRLTLALNEFEKVALYAGGREEIRETDVRAVVTPEREYNVFQLIDAIVAGRSGAALRQLRTLFDRVDRIENEAFPRLFPLLLNQFRLIAQARACLDGGVSVDNPSGQTLEYLPQKGRIDQTKDFPRKKATQSARVLSPPQIRALFAALVDADAKLKGQRQSYSGLETLEEMVLSMAAICRGRAA